MMKKKKEKEKQKNLMIYTFTLSTWAIPLEFDDFIKKHKEINQVLLTLMKKSDILVTYINPFYQYFLKKVNKQNKNIKGVFLKSSYEDYILKVLKNILVKLGEPDIVDSINFPYLYELLHSKYNDKVMSFQEMCLYPDKQAQEIYKTANPTWPYIEYLGIGIYYNEDIFSVQSSSFTSIRLKHIESNQIIQICIKEEPEIILKEYQIIIHPEKEGNLKNLKDNNINDALENELSFYYMKKDKLVHDAILYNSKQIERLDIDSPLYTQNQTQNYETNASPIMPSILSFVFTQ